MKRMSMDRGRWQVAVGGHSGTVFENSCRREEAVLVLGGSGN